MAWWPASAWTYDQHGDGGNVHLAEAVDRFLGAEAIKFTSKGGKGLHCLYALAEPMSVEAFVEWAEGFRERFRKPATWRSKLVPSDDDDAVAGVQWAFEAISQGHSIGHVIRGLHERGLTSTYGNAFTHSSVVGMLTNPSYAGVLQIGKYSRGKFCSVAEDGAIVVENAHDRSWTRRRSMRCSRRCWSGRNADRTPGRRNTR